MQSSFVMCFKLGKILFNMEIKYGCTETMARKRLSSLPQQKKLSRRKEHRKAQPKIWRWWKAAVQTL
jgi:hypothetical protein